ncbi:hypothetical protein EKK58_05895 [Candidatus Dependentiae bacterium]|nr:MAG: hypothetical protein EKK58_05895 [Candidatus Dependentiae bacterium]
MTTVPNLNPIPVVTGDDLLISHDIATNRSGRISASVLKDYISNQIIIDGDITASTIPYGLSTVAVGLDQRIKTIATYADISAAISSMAIGQQISLLGHTVPKIGGGIFDIVSSLGLSANSGTVVINGAIAAVRKVETFITPQMFGAIGDGVVDDTIAINSTIAAFPLQGSPNWKPWTLLFPAGTYKVTAPINVKNQQGSTIFGYGAKIVGNFNGTILQIGDLTGVNDILWTTIAGLTVVQSNTGLSAIAVAAQHLYSCTIKDCYFYGGQYAMVFDGNGNLVQRTTFRGGLTANVLAAGAANNEVNLFSVCAFELGANYGLDLQVNAGIGGGTEVRNCYFEANATANIRSKNSNMFLIAGGYFNLQNGAPGIVLDGTVGGSYPEGFGLIEDNRILGHASSSPGFIVEASASSINCSYKNNQLEGGTCNLYGLAPRSINLSRRRDFSYVTNGDTFTGGPPPTGWTVVGSAVSVSTSASPYGSGAGLVVPPATHAYQTIAVPINALTRFSVWAEATATGIAELQIWSIGLGTNLKSVSSSSTSKTRLELYLSPGERSSAATVLILLRNTGLANVKFSDIKIEDMTN